MEDFTRALKEREEFVDLIEFNDELENKNLFDDDNSGIYFMLLWLV